MSPSTQEFDFGGTADQKIERLIHYATRQGMSISAHSNEIADIRKVLRELEEDRQRREVEDGRRDERDKATLARLTAIEASLAGIKGVLNKAIAVIATGMGLALLNWMLGGGMKAASAALKVAGS